MRAWSNVRTTAPSTHRSRLRPTSASDSRAPSATSADGSMKSPPSSRMAISNVERVRSDGFSNRMATYVPWSAAEVAASRPRRRSRLSVAASARWCARSSGSKSRIERKHRPLSAPAAGSAGSGARGEGVRGIGRLRGCQVR